MYIFVSDVGSMALYKRNGFTLIELVVVIVILAILAIVALPRFINLGQDAHDSVAKSAFGSFSTAASLYHSCWLTAGAVGAVTDLACFGEGDIDSTVTGFALGRDTQGSGSNGQQLQGDFCRQLWQGLLDNDDFKLARHEDASFGGDTDIIYWYSGGLVSDPGTRCYFNYIADDRTKGAKNWQLSYYPYTGKTIISRVTLG
ncbi:type II secretion system protein [Shewanella colwelliana]|uniref:type II secretion system protein n=1 Tax=Shewanella colwelliana TaxID=23 RepID=UPI0004B199F4|nr:type II secretion system protein [Shewanella colwelliana]